MASPKTVPQQGCIYRLTRVPSLETLGFSFRVGDVFVCEQVYTEEAWAHHGKGWDCELLTPEEEAAWRLSGPNNGKGRYTPI